MELFRGDCGNLTSIACDNNGGSSFFSSAFVSANAGETFLVRVWEEGNNNFGDFNICVFTSPPVANNDCSSATILSVQNGSCTTQTLATNEQSTSSGLGNCTIGEGATANDVWFTFEATTDAIYTIETSTAGSSLNTVMEVFKGNCGNLISIACNDNANNSTVFSKITIDANTREDIFIRIWENGNNSFGDFNICVFSTPEVSNNHCANAIALPIQAGSCTDYHYSY